MRLGGPVFGDCSTPERWVGALRDAGFRAAYCPVSADASDDDSTGGAAEWSWRRSRGVGGRSEKSRGGRG